MLIERLSQNDLDLFQKYINYYGLNPGSSSYRSTETPEFLLRFWDKAKSEYLWKLMGENFILEKEVSYCESPDKLRIQIDCNPTINKFIRIFKNKISNDFPWGSDEGNVLRALVQSDFLAANKIGYIYTDKDGDFFQFCNIKFNEKDKIKIENTTKPLRALGKIAKFLHLESEFEEFRLEHSRILNQKALSGTLCLSIHPMDYITMSDNNSGWDSCMKWNGAGSYRMGTVEMMNSPMVIVAYLKSKVSEYTWHNNVWNDKHWRILITVSPDAVISIKGYPYSHEELTKNCLQWILELGAKNLQWNFNQIVEMPDASTFQYVDKNFYFIGYECDRMYNDFGCATHWGAFPKIDTQASKDDPIILKPNYSGVTECMCCGHETDWLYDESFVFCSDCASEDENSVSCSHCGGSWDSEDMYWIDDEAICPDCLDEVAGECSIRRQYEFYENLVAVYLAREDDNPDVEDDYEVYIHKDFIYSIELDRYTDNWFTEDVKFPRCKDGIYYFNKQDLTKRGFWMMYSIGDGGVDKYFKSPR